MHFSIIVVWLAYSFGSDLWLCKISETSMPNISPYHELHISLFRSRRKKAYKGLGEDTKHFERLESIIWGTCFYSKNLSKPPNVKLSKGMGEWYSMNRSICQPPRTRRKPKAPWRLRRKGWAIFDRPIQFKVECFVVTYAWWRNKILQQLLINNLKSSFAQGRAKFSLGDLVDAR